PIYTPLSLPPVPRPLPPQRSLTCTGLPSAAPAASKAKSSASCEYRGYREASAPAVYASRAMLPPPLQDSLPAGWLASTGWASNPLDRDKRFPKLHSLPPLLELS